MPVTPRRLPVTTAAQSAARDRAAIDAGTSSFALMMQAGTVTASLILRELADRLGHGVAILAGVGNNGGDAYIVAAQLARAGVLVRLHASAPPRTPDAQRAAALLSSSVLRCLPTGNEQLVVDGLLGTGHQGELRGSVAADCVLLRTARDHGATIVALDVPTGLDATTGQVAAGSVPAHWTVAYGTIKRGHVIARDHVGRVLVVDIGLGDHEALDDDAPWLVEPGGMDGWLPAVAWSSWKGQRGVIGLVGGADGMAGAIVLSARAALRSGAGLVHGVVADASVAALQAAVPQALAHRYEQFDAGAMKCVAVGIGPGMGQSDRARAMLERVGHAEEGVALVLDADALNLLAMHARADGRTPAEAIAALSRNGRHVVCTPHVGEFMRLYNGALPATFDERVAAVQALARQSGATVLLKGTPTIVCAADGSTSMVVARGTSALATGGSGDVLTGIITALLAQRMPGPVAAALGAWVHGRAAEVATASHGASRGVTLDEVLEALPGAWRELEGPQIRPAFLRADLPDVHAMWGGPS